MHEEFDENETKRIKKVLAQIRRYHSVTERATNMGHEDDSDFSPVDEPDLPKKRGPGRPRKIPLPERLPK